MELKLQVAVCNQIISTGDEMLIMILAADGTIKIWNTETGRQERTFEGHLTGISTIAWSPDSRWIASGGDDKVIRLWDVQTVTTLETFWPDVQID
jgi:WD40 repeat protein